MANIAQLEAARELEWRACKKDKYYFFRNYYHIPVVGVGATLYDPRDAQLTLHKAFDEHDMNNALKARQIGYTTSSVAEAMWDAIFNEEHPWLFISRGEDAAIKMLTKGLYAFNRLPAWMHDRIGKPTSLTQSVISFSNGSRIESIPTTAATGRGDAVYGAVIDEAAFIDNAGAVWAALEPLVYGKVLIVSTANGMGNFFHETWVDSQKSDSVWNPIFFPWTAVPNRDEAWYEKKRRSFRGREWYFYQEYPNTPEEAFIRSGRVAFDATAYDHCEFGPPEFSYEWTEDGTWTEVQVGEDVDIRIDIWDKPGVLVDDEGSVVQTPNYVVGCDVAEGLDHGDYSVVKVFDANTGEEVAKCTSHIPVESLGFLLEQIGTYYYTALIVVESNNHGILPISYLKKAKYRRLYRPLPVDQRRAKRSDRYGFHTNVQTKPKLVKDLLLGLRDMDVWLRDEEFRNEAQVYVSNGKGSYNAVPPNHDDIISATMLAWQGVIDVGRFPVKQYDYDDGKVTIGQFLAVGHQRNKNDTLGGPLGEKIRVRTKPSIIL